MDKLASGSELTKLSKENIRRTLDGLQDSASSVLLFTLQWKELESLLDQRLLELKAEEEKLVLFENAAQRSADEVEVRVREVEERFRFIVAREEEFDSRHRVENEKMRLEKELIRQSSEDLVLFVKSVDDKLKCIERKHDELVLMGNLNEKQLGELKLMESFIREKLVEMEHKEEEFAVKENHLQQCFNDLKLKGKKHEDAIAGCKLRQEQVEKLSQELRRQYQLKDKSVQEKEKKLEDRFKDLMAREKELAVKQRLETEILRKRYELEDKIIQEKEKKIEDRLKEIAAREEEFDVKQSLETERRQIDLESSRRLVLLGKSIEEKMKQLDIAENKLVCMGRLTERQLGELKLMEIFVKDTMNVIKQKEEEIALKGKHLRQCSEDLDLEGKCYEECCSELKQKEKGLEDSFEELRRQQELLDHNLQDLELRERKLEELAKQHKLQESIAMGPVVAGHSADADIHFFVTMDGRNLQIFLNEHWSEHSSLSGEIAIFLKQSTDPAKLVLDAMEGFYPPFLKKGDRAFEGDVARTSCIVLLDQLRLLAPEIKPHIKEQALKLARAWIVEVRADVTNPLKVLGFLQLLASYRLGPSFDADELCNLLLNVAGHHEAHRVLHALGFVDKISAFIQNLVVGKQYLKAINVIFAFELVNEFAPVRLLEEYLSYSKAEATQVYRNGNKTPAALIEADSRQISDLKAFIKCVEEHKLESQYSPVKLLKHKDLMLTLEKRVKTEKAKLDNLKKIGNTGICGHKQDVNGKLGGQKQNVNGRFDGQKQRENMKQILEDTASAPFSGSVKSVKSIGSKRPLEARSDGTAGNGAVEANATSSMKNVPSTSPDPGGSYEGYIKQLIENNRILEAVKYIIQFNMTDKFPPVRLLNNHLKTRKHAYKELSKKDNTSIEGQVKALNQMIGAIRAVIKCIEIHKLESEFPINALQKEVVELEKKKEEKSHMCQNPVGKGRPQVRLDYKESSQQQAKKSCTINSAATDAALMTSAAAAPVIPIPSVAAPAAHMPAAGPAAAIPTTALSPSSTAAPPETGGVMCTSGLQQHGKKSCTTSAIATTADSLTSAAVAPATPTPSAAALAAHSPAVTPAAATLKTEASSSTAAAPSETSCATYKGGLQQQSKKTCTIKATTRTAVSETYVAASPAAPTRSSALPAASTPAAMPATSTCKNVASPSSRAAPPEIISAAHGAGHLHPNKRHRTAPPEWHYSLSGYPSRNLHPFHRYVGVVPHYSFHMIDRSPNLDRARVHWDDRTSSLPRSRYGH